MTEPQNRSCLLGLALAAGFLLAPFAAAQEMDWDNLDSTYVTPEALKAVPELPPIPDVKSPRPETNWARMHWDDGYHTPEKELPAPLSRVKDVVTEENPLEIDVFYSMRSPYSYLVLYRLAYLHSNYNVDVNVRVIFPIAVRTRSDSGQNAELSGRWYHFAYSVMDMPRTARYQGIPFRFAQPDPILQDIYPQATATMAVASIEKQPFIVWLVRLGNAAELEGKSLEYAVAVSPLIWGARAPIGEWPLHIRDAVNSIGMNYDAVIADIRKNPEKYDAVWQKNAEDHIQTGHGSVPNMSWNGEPFYGQDRFNQLFWRLRENGLTTRKKPREPVVARPLRWPEGH
jgi:2-hydroxychromene-2-carboxylate isomerase